MASPCPLLTKEGKQITESAPSLPRKGARSSTPLLSEEGVRGGWGRGFKVMKGLKIPIIS
jgi:hypothetical protein